jgi:hypothetical protein
MGMAELYRQWQRGQGGIVGAEEKSQEKFRIWKESA